MHSLADESTSSKAGELLLITVGLLPHSWHPSMRSAAVLTRSAALLYRPQDPGQWSNRCLQPALALRFSTASSGIDSALQGSAIEQTHTVRPRRAEPPPLPESRTVKVGSKCLVEYVDAQPINVALTPSSPAPTVVMIHGAPGTFRDFRYMIPLLQRQNVRVIGINLPGFAGSRILDTENYYDHISALPAVASTYEALQAICANDEHVFVLGHSFGGHAAIHLTDLNKEKQKLNVKGLALLASAGFWPHKALQPRTNAITWVMLRSNIDFLETAAKSFVKWIYVKLLQFPDNAPADYFVAGIVRCVTADFSLVKTQVKRLRTLPSFLAWARDDIMMEEQLFLDVAAECHPGPRFAFEKGGHNIQKTKAEFLAAEMAQWMHQVIADEQPSYSSEPKVLP